MGEHAACILSQVGQKEAVLWRAVSQTWRQGVALSLNRLAYQVNGKPHMLESLLKCLSQLSSLHYLDLQRSRELRTEDLQRLLAAAPMLHTVDVTLARPLQLSSYLDLKKQFPSVKFLDVFGQDPSPEFAPEEVVFIQCYALQAGRVDICFNYASESNQASTGPLERFQTFFTSASPYAIMLHCDEFHIGDMVTNIMPCRGGMTQMLTCIVEVVKEGHRRLFEWLLSLEKDGRWATDGVREASWHDVMMAELYE